MRRRFVALATIVWTVMAGHARAATAEGAIVTNMATISYTTTTGIDVEMSYAITASVLVIWNPSLRVEKSVFPPAAPSGGTMTFRIWITNVSTMASAFNITASDRLPDNMKYAGQFASWPGGGGSWTPWKSPNGVVFTAGQPGIGQDAPYYLRWVLTTLGIGRSAFVRYAAGVL